MLLFTRVDVLVFESLAACFEGGTPASGRDYEQRPLRAKVCSGISGALGLSRSVATDESSDRSTESVRNSEGLGENHG
jgi:hypothetical protein